MAVGGPRRQDSTTLWANYSFTMKARPALVIFARAPLPGKTKTRLIPLLGEEAAAELYGCFLLDTVAGASQVEADIVVAVSECEHLESVGAMVQGVCPRAHMTVQSGADLGERILNAFREILDRGHPSVAIVGSDAASLPADRMNQAFGLLQECDVVLGPCYDGGYYLIALRVARPELLRDICWGSSTVFRDTVTRAAEIGASVALLDPWYDVDTPEDLALLRSHLSALAREGQAIPCPRTHEYLETRLGKG